MNIISNVVSMVPKEDHTMLIKIMLFYAFLSFVLGPFVGLALKKNKTGLTHGMIAGSILSIVLWYTYASKKITLV